MRFKRTQGFTLIDLIVAIGIFTLVTTVAVANFSVGSRNDSVRLGASVASGLLRRAQTSTLTGALLSDGTFPEGGYGVRLDASDAGTLTLFADKDGNFNYTDATEEVEDVALPRDVVFDGGTLNIVFSAPDADVYFNGAASEASKTVNFSSASSDVTQAVIIYRLSGQIRVQ
ncbi:MAG: prepilin-type N-terminal cleavage/methylation domain-containing protein [Parcubacteria group bacterium]|nr:prepilin-type N-terminal cleavage/methylation domain-containing protein [Parcubacteria group bacterium]